MLIENVRPRVCKGVTNGHEPFPAEHLGTDVQVSAVDGGLGDSVSIDHARLVATNGENGAAVSHAPRIGTAHQQSHEIELVVGLLEVCG